MSGGSGKYNPPTGAHQTSLSSDMAFGTPHTKLASFFHICDHVLPTIWQLSFDVNTTSRREFKIGIRFSLLEMGLSALAGVA